MKNDEITTFVLALLAEKGKLPTTDIGNYNFIDTGHIDSLGLIKFLSRIESKYDIEISDDDFENKQIRTVKGLAALISEKLSAQK